MEASATDMELLKCHLGRVPRGLAGIAARCECGAPLVVATAPRLDNGTPFPTTYYLSHPTIVRAASRIEAQQIMPELTQDIADNPRLAKKYQAAHEAYIADRAQVAVATECSEVPEIAGVSAGGMPTRVKCLHALIGHALAAGPGVNPIGDLALERSGWGV